MGLNLFRPNFSEYQVLDLNDLTRLAKGGWNGVAALAWALLNGNTTSGAYFLGDACRPSAPGGLSVSLNKGMGFVYAAAADDFDANIKPIILPEDQIVSFDANTDGSGFDRADSIVIRPLESEQGAEDVYTLDPITRLKSLVSRARKIKYGYQYQVIKGTPAASPLVPATPAGWYQVAVVGIQNGAGSILSSDIIDRRLDWTAVFSNLWANGGLLRLGPTGDFVDLMRSADAEGPFAAGDVGLVTATWDDVTPDGVLQLGRLVAHDQLKSSTISALGVDTTINALDGSGAAAATIRAANTAYAWGVYTPTAGLYANNGFASVTNPATGQYRFTFAQALPNNLYGVQLTDSLFDPAVDRARVLTRSTTHVDIEVINGAGTATNIPASGGVLDLAIFAN